MTGSRRNLRLDGLGLVPRLLLNNLLVIVAGAGTVLVSAFLLAPPVFQLHLQMAGVSNDSAILQHVALAVDDAVLVALGVGVLAASITGAAISLFVARRVAAPVRDAATIARQLADGHLSARVPDPGMGPEFATLAASVNELAHRLEQTEATRRRLTAELAHQLRTPIASIEATIEAVRDHVLPMDDQSVETLTAQSARLRRLVADLEVVSRAEERQLLISVEPIAVQSLVEAATAAQREAYRAAGVRLHASVAPGTPRVTVDPERIQEVLGGLLDNALRYTPAQGTVTIDARPGEETKQSVVVITVADTGVGFDPGDAENIFRRFTKSADSPGSGLGLTIARAILQAHHGSLTAHSDGPGHGARFTLSIPAVQPPRH